MLLLQDTLHINDGSAHWAAGHSCQMFDVPIGCLVPPPSPTRVCGIALKSQKDRGDPSAICVRLNQQHVSRESVEFHGNLPTDGKHIILIPAGIISAPFKCLCRSINLRDQRQVPYQEAGRTGRQQEGIKEKVKCEG